MLNLEKKEAMFYSKTQNSTIKCTLCNQSCNVPNGKTGLCGVRINDSGKLYSLVYGKAAATGLDPIEKKPLFHFHPGSSTYSISTVGCNFRCENCQNYEISQMPQKYERIVGDELFPKEVVSSAKRYDCKIIAYTYTEPTIFFEYAYDTARIAKKEGIKNIFVTNGYISKDPLNAIQPYLDAANIDLKSFSDDFYKKNCGARLQPVLDNIKLYKKLGIWIEITTLIIPTLNDSKKELKSIAKFIRDVGEDIPWHISAFSPMYELSNLSRTSLQVLKMARDIGIEEGLRYVYVGNVPGDAGEHTYCYSCGKLLIERVGFTIGQYHIANAQCPECNAPIDGVGLG